MHMLPMKKIGFVISTVIVLGFCHSCQQGDKAQEQNDQTQVIDSIGDNTSEEQALILKEGSFGGVILPFWQIDAHEEIRNCLENYEVQGETAIAEGGEFKVYNVLQEGTTICSFEMSMDDSTYLYELVLRDSVVADEYGLKVGDPYLKIKELRPTALKAKMGYHFHTYVRVPSSHIYYEITGDYQMPDDLKLETINAHEFDEADLKDWSIKRIIWGNEKS